MTIANDNAPGLPTEGAAQKTSSTLAHQSTANAPREVAFHTGVHRAPGGKAPGSVDTMRLWREPTTSTAPKSPTWVFPDCGRVACVRRAHRRVGRTWSCRRSLRA